LIRVRNPWGNEREWKGPWSDKLAYFCSRMSGLKYCFNEG